MSGELTGKRRFRSQRARHGREELVLQVEEHVHDVRIFGGWPEPYDELVWRDARTTDLTRYDAQDAKP